MFVKYLNQLCNSQQIVHNKRDQITDRAEQIFYNNKQLSKTIY